jgi:acetyltransferase-like isoleucine patch superfamily enzyme
MGSTVLMGVRIGERALITNSCRIIRHVSDGETVRE